VQVGGAAVQFVLKASGVVLATVAFVVSVASAQTARYGTPSGCAGKQAAPEPYLFYDGKTLITANATCTLTPAGTSRVTAQCEGPQGKFSEDYTLIVTAPAVEIFRASGVRQVAMPACR
jgi:hypothetical protein